MEGVEAGVREILLSRNADPEGRAFAYVRGLIGEVFETDGDHTNILEAALGDLDQVLIVSDSTALVTDADRLAEMQGRVNTICLDRIPPHLNNPDLSAQPGFVANLVDLVRYPEDMEHLARYLLGGTVVVESLSDGLAMARLAPGCRFITRRGEVMESDGRMSLGPAGTRAGLVSRKSELRQLAEEIESIDGAVAELDKLLSQASEQFAALNREQDQNRAKVSELEHARIQTEAAIANLQSSIDRLDQEDPLLAGESDSIDTQLAHLADRRREHTEKLAALEAEAAESQRRADRRQEEVELLAGKRADLAEELTERRVQAGEMREKRRSLSDRINSLRVSMSQAELGAAEARAEAESCKQRIAEGENTLAEAERNLASLSKEEETLSAEALRLRGRREESRAELEGLAAETKDERASLELAENRLHELQLHRQEAQVRRDDLVARVRDEMGMELADLYAQYQHEEQDWSEVEEEIASLKQKIDRLGNVNLDAIGEQEELEQRAGFLNAQRDDLVESRRQLEGLINRLDAECRERFSATFEATREHFQNLFRRLFGGGKADIFLEDPEDALESGIEIIAQPPGKELLSISLMSGGEKSMTAIALLLAVFKSRPCPFAVLDEVDAALDEANNERFNLIVTEFLADSQFIIITHSKRTMSIADKLYGVTMQEAGVSTLVSVKFDDESPDGQAVA
jgi:chromosome segregation protein